MLAKQSNAMSDILLVTEEVKQLTGSLLISKSLRLQTKYIGTQRTRETVHGVPTDITEDQLGVYFSNLGL